MQNGHVEIKMRTLRSMPFATLQHCFKFYETITETFLKQPFLTYEHIIKITTGQGDDYTTGCLLDYPYFKDSYKMTAVDLSKQQLLDADPRPIQQINFTSNLDRAGNTRIYFILEEAKETVLNFAQAQGTVKVL